MVAKSHLTPIISLNKSPTVNQAHPIKKQFRDYNLLSFSMVGTEGRIKSYTGGLSMNSQVLDNASHPPPYHLQKGTDR